MERVEDYAYSHGIHPITANEISVNNHLSVLLLAQNYVDSAVSKTCNVGDEVSFEEFKKVYMDAWEGGAKGCTTFRASGQRFGILNEVKEDEVESEEKVEACFIDPESGQKECS